MGPIAGYKDFRKSLYFAFDPFLLPVAGVSRLKRFGEGDEELYGVFDVEEVDDFAWGMHVAEGDGDDGGGDAPEAHLKFSTVG